MKIFWSWQSDTPEQTGKYLVRDALKLAINRLKQSEDIEEPARDDLHLDQDTQNTPGSPDLVRTILEKIEKSEVVVADVTLIGKTKEDKLLINSNVAIELGYALRACSDARLVLVFNKYYGRHEDLPFDLRHKGGAVVFEFAPEAPRSEIAEVRQMLAEDFIRKLKPILQLPSRLSEPLRLIPLIQHRLERRYPGPSGGSDDLFSLEASVENVGEQAAHDFRLDVDIPGEIVDGGLPYGIQVPCDRPGYARLSITNMHPGIEVPILHPEVKTKVLITFKYAIKDGSRRLSPEEWKKQLFATVYSGNMIPEKKNMTLAELATIKNG